MEGTCFGNGVLCIYILYRAKQQEMVLSDMCIAPGIAWDYCPRDALRRVSRVLKDEFDLVCAILFA